jgi:hypothetical protein
VSNWLIILVTLAYVGTAIDLGRKGDFGHCVMFIGYSLGNLGLLLALK